MAKQLMKGNEAFGEAAIKAGAEIYFCYPITPQTEVAEYLSKRMLEVGRGFLQGDVAAEDDQVPVEGFAFPEGIVAAKDDLIILKAGSRYRAGDEYGTDEQQ